MIASKVLRNYYIATFLLGVVMLLPMTIGLKTNDVGMKGAYAVILCFNVLCFLLLPLIMDWTERVYFKARFLALEEVAEKSPQLAKAVSEQCEQLSLNSVKFAVVEVAHGEPEQELGSHEKLTSYGLWRSNPRVVLTNRLLDPSNLNAAPSVLAELNRFSKNNTIPVFMGFAAIQSILLYVVKTFVF
ncbi:hypothetical protein KA183_14415 [bacterium]|nr:hypothetical protein [bacterium]QQR58932.1 MAG: hypothetical protein IPG59_05410 [Candidatus Melainabacteria bacterium]